MYLPALFIYQDLDGLSFFPDIIENYLNTTSYYQALPVENGNMLIKYPIGLSIFYLPFFLLGHLFAFLLGFPMDGYSAPYQVAIGFSSVVYSILALKILRKHLLTWFSDKAVGFSLILLALGTNYLQYVSIDGAMPHAYLFFLYSLILHFTIKWHEAYRPSHAILLGVLIGWAVVSRPTDLLVILIPLLWGMERMNELSEQVQRFLKKWKHLVLAILGGMSIIALQLLYWKGIGGQWINNQYEEHFQWLSPNTWKILFSWEKGWLVYTPLVGLILLGFIPLYKHQKQLFFPLFVFFLINLYVLSAWSSWKYAGSYSCRAYVQSYAVLIFPLAAMFEWILIQRKRAIILGVIIPMLIGLNLFQIWQYNQGIILAEGNSRGYYFQIFGKTSFDTKDLLYLHVPKVPSSKAKLKTIYQSSEGFETDTTGLLKIDTTRYYEWPASLEIQPDQEFIGEARFMKDDFPPDQTSWLKYSVWVFNPYYDYSTSMVSTIHNHQETKEWFNVPLHHRDSPGEGWYEFTSYIKVNPSKLSDEDEVKTFIWNQHGAIIWVDEIVVEILTQE